MVEMVINYAKNCRSQNALFYILAQCAQAYFKQQIIRLDLRSFIQKNMRENRISSYFKLNTENHSRGLCKNRVRFKQKYSKHFFPLHFCSRWPVNLLSELFERKMTKYLVGITLDTAMRLATCHIFIKLFEKIEVLNFFCSFLW